MPVGQAVAQTRALGKEGCLKRSGSAHVVVAHEHPNELRCNGRGNGCPDKCPRTRHRACFEANQEDARHRGTKDDDPRWL